MIKKRLLLAAVVCAFGAMGLQAGAQTLTPVDPAWRTGTLDNGMKYYIRKNAKPEGKACFWIAHDIGSLHETPGQNGLAHFLEHMAFNGLRHFPGKSMLEYMQSIGCSFGGNINASTGQQLTQYMLTDVPVSREGVIDTCLLILHDWSGHILCEPDELDAERGVIREEWRTGRSASRRDYEEMAGTLFQGTPYATRSVIGDTSIINNFPQKDILDFYHDWYRPNLQAVVIVGDFEVDKMEGKVKTLFGTLKNPEPLKTKAEFNIADNPEPITNVYKDPELTQSSVRFIVKFPRRIDKTNRHTEEAVRYNMVNNYITAMLNARMNEARQLPDTKFVYAETGTGNFAGDRDAFMLYATSKNSELGAAFDNALTIIEQARRFGFTPGELERIKAATLRSYESSYAERNNKRHTDYKNAAFQQFQRNAPMMDEEQWLNLTKKLHAGIQVDELNAHFQKMMVPGPNTIIYASGPDKADVSMPDDEMLRIIMYGVAKKQLTAYEDVATDKPLVSAKIKPGKVTKESKNTAMDATEWTLSNGAKVVLKPLPYREDDISFAGFSFGGSSLLSDSDWQASRMLHTVMQRSGLGEFDRVSLLKMLAGKKASAGTGISDLHQSISGSCSPKDLETMLQLAYLYFTAPRFDQNIFEIETSRIRDLLKNESAEPEAALRDTLGNLLNSYHPRAQSIKEADLDLQSLEKMKAMYRQRFANPGAFTFLFVGNIDLKTAKPLVEKYLGGLTGNKKETYKDLNKVPVKGQVKRHFQRPMQVAKASVNMYYTGEMAATPENEMALSYLSAILRLRYTEEIREKRGGSYGASVGGSLQVLPKQTFTLAVSFDTDPNMVDELTGVVRAELQKIADNGPLAEDFQKTATNMKLRFEQNQKENSYWYSVLYNYYYYSGRDTHNTWEKAFAQVDAKTVQALAKEILKQQNTIEVVMLPE